MCAKPVAILAADGAVGAFLAAGLTERGREVISLADPADAPAGVGAVVDAGLVAAAPVVTELAALDAAEWESSAEEPLRRALHVLQAAHRQLPDGGRIVVLLPSLVATGAAGVVPWVAAAEGYRSMVKAAARTWGRVGVTVNSVLVPADLIAGTSLDRPGLQPPALGGSVDIAANVTDVVAALVSGSLDGVTGQTIAVDGGVWMTP
jgi:3-oxoacyl-[acyl-carrier protein] reductase